MDAPESRLFLSEFLLTLPILLAVVLSSMNELRLLAHMTPADLALLFAVMSVVIRALITGKTVQVPVVFFLPGLLMLLPALLQVALYQNVASFVGLLFYLVASTAVPLVIYWSAQGNSRLLLLLAIGWLAGHLFSIMVGITTHHGIWFFGLHDESALNAWGGYRISGLSTHPNMLATFTTIMLPFLVVMAFALKRWLFRFVAVLVAVIFFYALDLTGSRAGMAAVLVAVPVVLWICVGFTGKGKRIPYLIIIVGMLGLSWIATDMLSGKYESASAIERILGGGDSERSDSERKSIRKATFERIDKAPVLGSGYQDLRQAHNFFLQFLQCGGALGLLGFVIYIGLLAYWSAGAYAMSLSHSVTIQMAVIAVSAGLLSWLMMGMFQNAVTERPIYVAVGILLTLYYGLKNGDFTPDRQA